MELRKQGLSGSAIGRELGVDPKTAAKGIDWLVSQYEVKVHSEQ